MTPTQLTTSLELSKQLKKVGFEKESLFYWAKIENNWRCVYREEIINYEAWIGEFDVFEKYPAYTAEELLEWLPIFIDYEDDDTDAFRYGLKIIRLAGGQINSMYENIDELVLSESYENNLHDSLAKLLIRLIEEKIITV